eukprot:scaffold261_cov170-Amphora_coffeaeformis.AAC.23
MMKSSKQIHNPYKRTRKQEEVGKKRYHRPWEPTAGGIQPQRPSEPSVHHAAAVPSNPSQESSSSLDDSFDGGIDWTSIVQTLEDQSAFDATRRTQQAPPKPPPPALAPPMLLPTRRQESPRVNENPPAAISCKRTNRSQPSIFAYQAKENNQSSNKGSVGANALSDLRPSSWYTSSSKPIMPGQSSHTVASMTSANETVDLMQQSLPSVLRFQPKDVAPVRDEYQKQLVKNANINEPLLNGWTLFNHQKRAILKALAMRRCILALDMGLGKTLIGCVWAKAFVKTLEVRVVVLCPVSLQEEWKRNMEQTVGLVVQDINKISKKTTANGTTVAPSVSIHSWSKVPSSIEETNGNFVVVADEAHCIQSMTAGRTQQTLRLVSSPLCEGVLLLTGTPMKNGKPANLFPLLKAVNHPLGRHQKTYESHFCGGREISFGARKTWQASGAANLEQLRTLAKSHMLHLTKETCLKELPPLTRNFLQVPVSSRRQMQHNTALQDLAKIYETKSSGSDDRILAAVEKLRMVGSLAKVEACVEHAKKILLKEPAVVIFASFQEVVKEIHRQLAEAGWKGELLTGATPQNKRQTAVDNFQQGLSPVFCCTFGAGGVGLTLIAAHSVILCDRPWTASAVHQAEDRVRRIGQTRPVTSIWLRAFDLDEQIDSMIEQKKQTAAAVLSHGASAGSGEQQSGPRLSIFQMLKSILPAKNDDGLTQTSMLKFSQGT